MPILWSSLLDGRAVWDGNDCCRGPINERALPALVRAAAASLEGVEVIEQASPEVDPARMDLQKLECENSRHRLEC